MYKYRDIEMYMCIYIYKCVYISHKHELDVFTWRLYFNQ